jgi:hypothetical protein
MSLFLTFILVLIFAGGGGFVAYRSWGPGAGLTTFAAVFVVLTLLYLFGVFGAQAQPRRTTRNVASAGRST